MPPTTSKQNCQERPHVCSQTLKQGERFSDCCPRMAVGRRSACGPTTPSGTSGLLTANRHTTQRAAPGQVGTHHDTKSLFQQLQEKRISETLRSALRGHCEIVNACATRILFPHIRQVALGPTQRPTRMNIVPSLLKYGIRTHARASSVRPTHLSRLVKDLHHVQHLLPGLQQRNTLAGREKDEGREQGEYVRSSPTRAMPANGSAVR